MEIEEQHVHGEAFKLMAYISDDGKQGELLWNSRDGVTPFIITARDGRTPLTHADWTNDVYAPAFRPPPGMRVFVDMTPERKQELAMQQVERYWDHPEYALSRHHATKEEAAKVFTGSFNEGEPDIVDMLSWGRVS